MSGQLLNEQRPFTMEARGDDPEFTNHLIYGENIVLVPAREFLAANNGVMLPPLSQGGRLSVFCHSDSAELLKVWPSDDDLAPPIDTIPPGTGVVFTALGSWQCQPM